MSGFGFNPNFYPNAPKPPCCSGGCPSCNQSGCRPTFSAYVPQQNYGQPNFSPHQRSQPALHWVDTNAWGGVPSTALRGGMDIDGHQIYVGRAFHEGDWLPAKVIPGRNVAYVAYNGGEHVVNKFQVLCELRFDWVPDCDGRVPPTAVEGGRTADGEKLFIGRVYHEHSQQLGKIHGSHGVCYIPFNGKEMPFKHYEVLTLRR